MDSVSKYYVINIKGFDPDNMSLCTIVYEGSKLEVLQQEANLLNIAEKYMGMDSGEEGGIRSYNMTFGVSYLRDFTLKHRFFSDSIETSCAWTKIPTMIANLK
jgi:alkyldihydroxyacetonephosphate synthase